MLSLGLESKIISYIFFVSQLAFKFGMDGTTIVHLLHKYRLHYYIIIMKIRAKFVTFGRYVGSRDVLKACEARQPALGQLDGLWSNPSHYEKKLVTLNNG